MDTSSKSFHGYPNCVAGGVKLLCYRLHLGQDVQFYVLCRSALSRSPRKLRLLLTDDTLVSAMDPESDGTARTLISTFDLKRNEVTQALHIPAALGTIWALGSYVLALYGWPRLYDRQTGALLAQWPELKSGQQDSSIIHHLEWPAPCAVDRQGMRFALGTQTGVTVIQLNA